MDPLPPPHIFHLNAAQGWLGLGNADEARAELEQVPATYAGHPEVLQVRWEILAAAKDWAAGLEVAAELIHVDPEEPSGWFHRSYCLHELRRTVEARDNLLRVVEKFPGIATIRYNLACYECQLGRLDHARIWLRKAFRLGRTADMKAQALEDRDLEALWPELRGGMGGKQAGGTK